MKPATILEIAFHDSFCFYVMLLKINLNLIHLFLRSFNSICVAFI